LRPIDAGLPAAPESHRRGQACRGRAQAAGEPTAPGLAQGAHYYPWRLGVLPPAATALVRTRWRGLHHRTGAQGEPTRSHSMTTKEQLIERYGPLLSLIDLSEQLNRSPDGLRVSLRSQTEFAEQWNAARTKVGRRVYFRASVVADLIDAA